MKKIDIQINKAKILSYNVELKDDKPEISATIALLAGEKQISTFTLRTQTYYGDSIQFELPASLYSPIMNIAKELEIILIKKLSIALAELPLPKK